MKPRPLQLWGQAKWSECGHLLQKDINWAASMASNSKGACWPKWVLVMGIKNVLTAKLTKYSKLGPNGQNMDKKMHFWHLNYMGVASRLPIASPRHRPMETYNVHYVDFICRALSCQNLTMVCIINADIYSLFIFMHICHSVRYSIIDKCLSF